MRTFQKILASAGFFAVSLVLVGACSNKQNDCNSNLESCNDPTGGSAGSGGSPPPPPACKELPSANAEVIRDDCAYFVGGPNGADSNAGTEAQPFATLQVAVDAASKEKARVYVCGDHAERIQVPGGVSIFGGFDCTNAEWVYDGTKSKINPPAPATPDESQASVTITGTGSVPSQLEDLVIEAQDAAISGGSSIALIVDKSEINVVRTDLIAGAGQAGVQPPQPTDNIGPTDQNDPAIKGNDGNKACMGGAMGNIGGDAKANMLCASSIGGKGGTGLETTTQPADPGAPEYPQKLGAAGTGETGGAMGKQCTPGGIGENGPKAADGAGATDADVGLIDPVKGYTGIAGKAGDKGKPGQGGGGGGASLGKMNCFGASGGSGGAGGCPGNGGLGGTAGGASIAILSIQGKPTFDTATAKVSVGGKGGDGGIGQDGATGGAGGKGGVGSGSPGATNDGCDGGKGGRGSAGGQGGGGRGGHSLGVAFQGTSAPALTGLMITLPGANMAAAGGAGADAAGNGASGVVAESLEFK